MHSSLRSFLLAAAAAAGLMAAGAASAQGTWNLGAQGTSSNPDYCEPSGNPGIASCTAQASGASGINATMYAYSNTGTNGAFVQANLAAFDPLGFGVYSGSNETAWLDGTHGPQHAFDNLTTGCGSSGTTTTGCGGSVELMLIYFTSAVKLTTIDFSCYDGYNGSPGNKICVDGDFSIYRADSPPASAGTITSAAVSDSGATTSTALGAGWSLVGSADMMTQGSNATNPNNGRTDTTKEMSVNSVAAGSGNTNNLYSSWWIISTYFGPSTTNSAGASLNAGNDAFKILSFAATGCAGTVGSNGVCSVQAGVPEPATLALVSLALAGAGWVGRRRSGVAPAVQ